MCKLTLTEEILSKKVQENSLTSYALIVGHRDKEWILTSPNVNLDTYFDAASTGKVFPTSILALKAIDNGQLSLTDTLEKFFPNVPKDKKNITVQQLMTHTSGMLRKEFPENVSERGRESIIEFIFNTPLDYEPGTHYAYCCTGMVLLGFIIEIVYNMSLDKAFQKHLCVPLNLTRSKYNISPNEKNAVNCNCNPKIKDIQWDDHNVKMMNGIPAGAGGLFITAGDLQKFIKALLKQDKTLYSTATIELSEQNYTKNIPVLDIDRGIENHGLGFTYVNKNCIQAYGLFDDGSIGHDGWTGQSFYLSRRKNIYVILLTDATRCYAKNHGYIDYTKICNMRKEIHNAIKKDLQI